MIIQTPDLINGLFELLGAVSALLNCKQMIKDKQVKGVNWITYIYYTIWSIWNLYYYPSLDQWFSFIGGVIIAIGNIVWLSLLCTYTRLEKRYPFRKIFPNTIAEDICGVQPMPESSKIFTLRTDYIENNPRNPNDSIFKGNI